MLRTERRRLCARFLVAMMIVMSAQAMAPRPRQGEQMTLNLPAFQTAEEAKAAIARELPKGSSRRKVEEWLEKSGLNCFPSSLRHPYIACRQVMPSSNMVHVVWSLGFFFTDNRELERIEVSKGLSGP